MSEDDIAFLRRRRGELVIERDRAREAHRVEIVRLYDRLAAINDAIEVGDDGYARFGSLNDRDHFREIVRELEPRGLGLTEQAGGSGPETPAQSGD